MKSEECADIKYSKQLANMFPEAKYYLVPFYSWDFKTKEHDFKSWRIEEKSRFTSQPKFTNQGGAWYTEEDKKYRRTLLQRWEDRIPALTTDMALEKLRSIENLPEIKIHAFKDNIRAWLPIQNSPLFQGKKLCNILCKMLIWLKAEGWER